MKLFAFDKPCKLWPGKPNSSGYGVTRSKLQRRNVGAHVRAWEDEHGTSPEKGIDVCHKCDVRLCVEPSHLFLGSRSENIQDAHDKGRMPQSRPENRPRGPEHQDRVRAKAVRGTAQHLAKLDDEKVRQIRTEPMPDDFYAAWFCVSTQTVWAARTFKTWKHVV